MQRTIYLETPWVNHHFNKPRRLLLLLIISSKLATHQAHRPHKQHSQPGTRLN